MEEISKYRRCNKCNRAFVNYENLLQYPICKSTKTEEVIIQKGANL